MAPKFVSAVLHKMRFGRNRVHVGTFTSTGTATGGSIDTGMRLVDFLIPWEKSATAPGDLIGLNADFSGGPIDGSAIPIVTIADKVGYWLAVGR